MANQEDIENQQNLLYAHRRTLTIYLEQRATLGSAYVPPGITNGIREAREEIRHIKATLRKWGVEVEDDPLDDAPFRGLEQSDSTKVAKLFTEGIRAHVRGHLWEAKRYYEMTLTEDPFYPQAAEKLDQVQRQIAREQRRKFSLSNAALVVAFLALAVLSIVSYIAITHTVIPGPLTNTPSPTDRPWPQTSTATTTLVPAATPKAELRFEWQVTNVCDKEPDVIGNRVHNLNQVDVQVTGFIKAKPDGGQETTISEVPPQYQNCPSGAWCGPEERIRNHYPKGFQGLVWGTTSVHYQGGIVESESFGPVQLTCGG